MLLDDHLSKVSWCQHAEINLCQKKFCTKAQWPVKSFGPRISPFLRDDSTVKLRVSRYLDWLSHTFTIIYACIIMTHRTTGSLSEYQLLRTSHKLRNYCIHRSTIVERLQVCTNIVAVTAGLHADNLHVGIFSMQEWHLFQENSKKITLPIHHNYHHPTVSIRPSYLFTGVKQDCQQHYYHTSIPPTLPPFRSYLTQVK